MGCASPARVSLIIITVAVFVGVLAINGLAAGGGGGVFWNNTGDISDKYYLEITPAGWTFSIWGFIYAWQVAFLGYGLSTLCRKGLDDQPLYMKPDIMPWQVYLVYNFTGALNITWLFLWDRELMPAALAIIALLPASLYLSTALSCVAVDKNLAVLYNNNLSREAWLVRFLVQNALAFYAAWVTIATLLNLGVVLVYWGNFDQSDSCSGCLGVLTFDIVVYLTLDWFVLDRYIRYIFSPYIVVIFALIGSLEKNYVAGETNSIFTVVLLSIACAAAVIKIVLLLWRHCKKPLNAAMIFPTMKLEKK